MANMQQMKTAHPYEGTRNGQPFCPDLPASPL